MGGGPVFQIDPRDNVATALHNVTPGMVNVRGAGNMDRMEVLGFLTAGHKVALADIKAGEAILKYGVVIGEASVDIAMGSWVHLHNMRSRYDERSSHLNVFTGAPTDTHYK